MTPCSLLFRIDGATNTVAQSVSAGSQPCGIAVANGKLWIAALGDNAVISVDPVSGATDKTIDVGGQGWDVQAGFGSIWVPVQGADEIVRIDPTDGSIIARIPGGPLVSGLAITPTEVWVANQAGTTIDRIDPAKNKIVGHIDLPAAPFWFAVGDKSALVALSNADSVVLLDATTGQAGQPITVGTRPRDPGFVGGNFWMPNQVSGDVTVLDPASGKVLGSFMPPDASGIWVADEAFGDGWILDYGGTAVFRSKTTAGLP